VVGVEFLKERKLVSVHAFTTGQHLGAELCPASQLGLRGFGAEDLFREETRRPEPLNRRNWDWRARPNWAACTARAARTPSRKWNI
jgi:hypothetical protein